VLASSLAVFGAWGVAVFIVLLAVAACLRFYGSLTMAALVLVILCLMCVLFLPAVESARESGRRASCSNNLKQIAISLLEYETAHGSFPPAYIVDKNGKPMHSWRALILPYLDMDPLYRTYKLNEPWDGPNNKQLTVCYPPMYYCPSDPDSHRPSAPQSSYFAVTGPNTAWDGAKPKKLADFGSDAANTILVVEVKNSGVAWLEPKDLSLDDLRNAKTGALTPSSNHGRHSDFFFNYDDVPCASAAMADGSVRFLPPGSLSPERLPKLLEIGGCKQSDLDVIASSYEAHRRPNWRNIAALAVWLISVAALLTRAVRSRRPPRTASGVASSQ
jgi:hypothetical protein